MISHPIIHPEILFGLAAAGHGSTILVTDAHYAAASATYARARIVYLALQAGSPTVSQVLDAVRGSIPVESWMAIRPAEDALPCLVQDEVQATLRLSPALVSRDQFYAAARDHNLVLCIVTGDTRRFGNVLLTVGVNRGR